MLINAVQADIAPLNELVRFEQNIQSHRLTAAVRVTIDKKGKELQLWHDGTVFRGKIDRPLIHQLGGRAWGQSAYTTIEQRWNNLFQQDPRQLEQELSALFAQHELLIRYYRDSRGANQIYGVVTDKFVEVNQLAFRQQFLEQIRDNTALVPQSYGMKRNRSGDVIESFKFDMQGFQTEYRYGLIYAKNSGYDAYKVSWGRMVLICTNGLKAWRGTNFRWKHTREIDLTDFIQTTVNDGIGNQKWLEDRIGAARGHALNSGSMTELMGRLSLAKASIERVNSRLRVEANDVGYNEWALSQALTWLGNHERYISNWGKRQLIGLGTDILENSLDQVLSEESRRYVDGSYGLLLPQDFRRAA
ncbi:hypothetical protein D5085_01155 [Ectothiorhodospiraceae bacterium BW-2]|nr:hypothetical protein D5085_01155 [Ectothiorhodospiraceae bacterium BW-2]